MVSFLGINSSVIRGSFLIITMFISGCIINSIQLTLYLTLRNFNKRLHRKISYYLAYSIQSQLMFMLTWRTNTNVILYIDKNDRKYYGKEHVLFLGNHTYDTVDWVMGWYFSDNFGVLANCKAFVKKSIGCIPILGWTLGLGESVFLDRSYDKDKTKILKQSSELGDFPDPIWLILFPEGSRLTPTKLKASQEFSKKHNLPVLKHHLLPRTRGFISILEGMRDKIHVIGTYQIAFHKNAKYAPTFGNIVLGNTLEAHVYCERILVKDLPTDEAGLTKWLYEHFEKKDKLQDSFYNTGSFFKESGVTPIEPMLVKRRIWPIINSIFWNMFTLILLFNYFISFMNK